MNITKEQMLLNMERVRRHVPYDVWFAIVCLIESSGEKAKTIIEKDSGPRQRCSGCGRQAADDPTFPDDYCVKCWPDHKALLRDKLQSWPGDEE